MELELIGTDEVRENDKEYLSNVFARLLDLLESIQTPENMTMILEHLNGNVLLESDVHPLVTPDFVGTDEEKIAVLSYWAELIGLLRSINVSVISHDNKLGILDQLKAEIEFLDREINNTTSAPVENPDGSVDLRKTEAEPQPEEKVIDLTQEEVKPKKLPWWQEEIRKVAESKKLTPAAMKRIAGIR